MLYLLFGLITLLIAVYAMQGFTRANPAVLARQIRLAGGGAVLAAAAVLGVRGSMSLAIPLGMVGWWLVSGQGAAPWGWPGPAGKPAGQTSRVVTDHLEMELDHDTGEMRGRVLRGRFIGHDFETLTPHEMAQLWQECRFSDPQSAQLIEAYLDRMHPSWREDLSRENGVREDGVPPDTGEGPMTVTAAYKILGLRPGATENDIRRAHKELMMKVHPDRGGSTYLAAKINEAKDVLLG